jgi:hypothetical protein
MAIFAELDESNNVIQVIVVNDIYTKDGEQGGIDFLIDHYGHNRWKQTWDNGAGPTKNYAGIGYTYDSTRDAFISQKPFESFVLNEDTCRWEAPVPKPNDKTKLFYWDENSLSWIEEIRFNYRIENEVVIWE